MAIFNTTLDALVERVCKLGLQDWTEGTATAVAAGSITDTSRVEVDDYWNDLYAELYIRTGVARGNNRVVSDFVNSTNIISVTPNFSTTPVIGDKYSLHTKFKRDEVVEAINTAIEMVLEDALFWKVDENSITALADVYEYLLPVEFVIINKITEATDAGLFYGSAEIISPASYRIIRSAQPKIQFLQMPKDAQYSDHWYTELWQPTTGRKLRIEGLAKATKLAVDTDATPINPAYILHEAAALLWSSRIKSAASDPDFARIQADLHQKRADLERQRLGGLRLPPDSKRTTE